MRTLTKEQRRAWEIDGYVRLPGVFDAEEAAAL